jgi:hypothetical protein
MMLMVYKLNQKLSGTNMHKQGTYYFFLLQQKMKVVEIIINATFNENTYLHYSTKFNF